MLRRKDRSAEQILDDGAEKELSAKIAALCAATEPYLAPSIIARPVLPLADYRIASFRRQVDWAKLRRP